jgi:Domain of unknown function (DUF4365)
MPGKKRTGPQMMEDQSLTIVRALLPREWVARDYKPDYGIDLVIELFDAESGDPDICVSLGELLFVQVKSVERTAPIMLQANERSNVAKGIYQPGQEYTDIECIAYSIDTALLETVICMGSAVPVMLLLVSLEDSSVYFVCLNDYVDKVLIPEHKTWRAQKEVTLHIPTANRVTSTDENLLPLRIYAQRSKLMAAFNLFAYQLGELEASYDPEMAKHFLSLAGSYDFWDRSATLGGVSKCRNELRNLEQNVAAGATLATAYEQEAVLTLWNGLANMGSIFEEVWREMWLPTFLATLF